MLCWTIAANAGPGDIVGFTDMTAVQAETDGLYQSTLRREGSVNWSHKPSPFFTIQGGLRFYRFDLDVDLEGEDWRQRTQASGRLAWRPELVSFSSGWVRRELVSRSGQGDVVTDIIDASLSAHPETWPLMSLRYAGQQIRDRVDVSTRDTRDHRLEGSLDWTRERTSLGYGLVLRRNDNVISGLRTRQTEHQGRLSIHPTSGSDAAVRMTAQFSLDHDRTTDELIGSQALLEFLPVIGGLFAIDGSPGIGPLDPVEGLNDGDVETPTTPAIDLGDKQGRGTCQAGLDELQVPRLDLRIVDLEASEPHVVDRIG